MPLFIRGPYSRMPHPRRRRRGFSTALMLASATVLIGLMALAIDLAMVTLTAQQIQAGANAAALAAAAENFDRSLLCPDYADLDLPLGALARHPTAAQIAQFESDTMREQAQTFVAFNESQGHALSLADNPSNDEGGDIVIINVDDPTAPNPAISQWPLAGHANGVQITIPRTTARGNPLTLWIAKAFGVTSLDISPFARAAFDQRVFGFVPGGAVPVPALPFISDANAWPSPVTMTCLTANAGNDQYAVSPATGAVAAGADGFPEFQIRIRQSQTLGQAHPLPLRGVVTNLGVFQAELTAQIAQGLYASDLSEAELGGGLVLRANDQPRDLNRVAPAPTAALLTALRTSLLAIRGEERIWPIGEVVTVAGVPTISRISNFAAGRVVNCIIDENLTPGDDSDDSLLITVQPCLLQTSTALVRASSPSNRWLGKLMLIK